MNNPELEGYVQHKRYMPGLLCIHGLRVYITGDCIPFVKRQHPTALESLHSKRRESHDNKRYMHIPQQVMQMAADLTERISPPAEVPARGDAVSPELLDPLGASPPPPLPPPL